ncbi:MAG: hypothetical protein CNLJKLNK_00511 [Holosporales bacterium]
MKIIFYFLVTLWLAGCSSSMNPVVQEGIHIVPVGDGGTLSLDGFFPLEGCGQYIQKIEATAQNQKHIFSLYLDIHPHSLHAIALHDIQGRIYDLMLDFHKGLTWSSIPEVAEKLKPDYILADFLLTHLSCENLKKNLKGVSIHDQYENNKRIRVLKKGEKIIRIITTKSIKNHLWQYVEINNPHLQYVIKIETVNQI